MLSFKRNDVYLFPVVVLTWMVAFGFTVIVFSWMQLNRGEYLDRKLPGINLREL